MAQDQFEKTTRSIPPEARFPKTPQYAGKTLTEEMWEVIDSEMDTLMESEYGTVDHARSSGFCLGAATVLSVFLNPYRPDVDEIRRFALARWQYRHYESETWT
jgi:hypothetical protein